MNWNKSGKLEKGDSHYLWHIHSGKAKLFSKVSGAHVFKTKYGWFDCFHCC